MDQKIFTYPKKGALSLGVHKDGSADEQNCGNGSLSVGENVVASGDGCIAQGYSDRGGGVVAKGLGAKAQAVSLQESSAIAEGTASAVQGRAVNKSTLLAKGESSSVAGSASNGSSLEATGREARVRAIASDGASAIAEGALSSVEGILSEGGVMAAKGVRSSIDGRVKGGYLEVKGDNTALKGYAGQFSKVLANGEGSDVTAFVWGAEESPTRAQIDADSAKVLIVSSGGHTSLKGARSEFKVVNNGGAVDVDAPFSSINAVLLSSGEKVVFPNPGMSATGLDISVASAFSAAVGVHGSSKGLLPGQFLFAGNASDSPPAASTAAYAYGAYPLAQTSAAGFRSSLPGFCEMHEWADGNSFGENRIARFVSFKGNKLVLATSTEEVDGVVVPAVGGFIANIPNETLSLKTDYLGRPHILLDYSYSLNLWLMKQNLGKEGAKYVTTPITDEKTLTEMKKAFKVPDSITIDPVYMVDPSTVTARKNGPVDTSYAAVCFLGTPIVIDNGSCEEGERCICLDGVASPSEGGKWKVLERKSNTTVRILFK